MFNNGKVTTNLRDKPQAFYTLLPNNISSVSNLDFDGRNMNFTTTYNTTFYVDFTETCKYLIFKTMQSAQTISDII